MRSYLLRELFASPCSRADIASSLPSPDLPGENFGLSASLCLPGENFGFAKMPFTSVARANNLGVGFTGRQHPIYENGKVIFDNAVFPSGSPAVFVRLMTVNCEEYRKALVGASQKNKFSKLIDGLVSNQGQRTLLPKTLGLCDPSENPESMALLTQPQQACKQAAERGTSMPPDMESEAWQDYKRMNKWSVGGNVSNPSLRSGLFLLQSMPWLPLHYSQE